MSTYQLNGETIVISEEMLSQIRIIAEEYTAIICDVQNIWIYSIAMVDNIECNVYISYDMFDKKLYLELNDGNIDFTEKKNYGRFVLTEKVFLNKTDITIEDMVDAIVNMKQRLSHCKFDKCSGRFNNIGMNHFYEVFKDCGNIELKIKECCVCYTATIDKTVCGHSLCVPCFQSLKLQFIEEENIRCKICPICRRVIENILP